MLGMDIEELINFSISFLATKLEITKFKLDLTELYSQILT